MDYLNTTLRATDIEQGLPSPVFAAAILKKLGGVSALSALRVQPESDFVESRVTQSTELGAVPIADLYVAEGDQRLGL